MLNGNRGGYGAWNATQATVLALNGDDGLRESLAADAGRGCCPHDQRQVAGKVSYEGGTARGLEFTDIASTS